MTVEQIAIENREQWLALRRYDITASVIPAVFGLHPYISASRLYLEKQGLIDFPPAPETGPMRRGRILESAVAVAVGEQRPEWKLEKCQTYYRDADLGIGATPDFFIRGDARGLGILQAKTVAPSVFDREWKDRPPTWIILQAATEMMLTGATFGAVAALVVDPYELPCPIFEIPRHADAEQRIKEGVARFWGDIEAGIQPEWDYGLDRELIKQLSPKEVAEKTIDMSGDNEFMDGVLERERLRMVIKADEERVDTIEAMMMAKMQDAAVAIVPDFNVTWKLQHRNGYTVAPKDSRVLSIRRKRVRA